VTANQPPARDGDFWTVRRNLLAGGVMLLTALLYLRCLGNGFVFDDHEMIVINGYIGQWSFLWRSLVNDSWWFRDPLHLPQSSYYRPLQDIWLGLHYQLFGLAPAGWHATMVALHLIAVWLVFKIAERLTGDLRAALLAALLFGLLPVHAEAIVWPTAIPLSLSGTFELAAFYLFIKRDGNERRNLILALLLYAGALFTHESAVVFPAIVALYVFLIDAPKAVSAIGAQLRQTLIRTAPLAAETLVYLVIRYCVLGFISRPNPVNHATLAQVLLTIPPALAIYLSLLLMPWTAGPSHRLTILTSAASPEFWLPAGSLLVAAGAFVLLTRVDRRGRLYLFCAAWTAIALAPMLNLSGLFQQGLIQDRYLYLASAGWCLIVADLMIRFADRSAGARRAAYVLTGAIVVTCGAALWQVQSYWHDEVALFTRCIDEFPESAIWHNRLGMALEARGDLTGADRALSASLKLDPEDGATLYDLGLVHAKLGRVNDAAREVAEGLKRLPYAPPDAYLVLAQLYEASGDHASSEAALKYAESLPGGIEAVGLARARMKAAQGDDAAAAEVLRPKDQDH
jgi:tetratricopeptide (TPR) repeat protein